MAKYQPENIIGLSVSARIIGIKLVILDFSVQYNI